MRISLLERIILEDNLELIVFDSEYLGLELSIYSLESIDTLEINGEPLWTEQITIEDTNSIQLDESLADGLYLLQVKPDSNVEGAIGVGYEVIFPFSLQRNFQQSGKISTLVTETNPVNDEFVEVSYIVRNDSNYADEVLVASNYTTPAGQVDSSGVPVSNGYQIVYPGQEKTYTEIIEIDENTIGNYNIQTTLVSKFGEDSLVSNQVFIFPSIYIWIILVLSLSLMLLTIYIKRIKNSD